jgi:hypothetical protein
MFFGILTLATALMISTVAIYYSVAGLVTIFAAAAIPIIIMGSVLETAKLVTAVWLHWYWNQAAWWLKTYLVSAVIVLMLITSTGIFGFLSRAHIEQTTNATESLSVIERINTEINRLELQISRAESTIQNLESKTSNFESTIQDQIDREQNRINLANARIEPLVQEQQSIIQNQQSILKEKSTEISQIDQSLKQIDQLILANDISSVQLILGISQDGILGPNTRNSIQQYRSEQNFQKSQLLDQILELENQVNLTVNQARQEISRLRQSVEQQILQSNDLISRLQEQIGQSDQSEIENQIQLQIERIQSANREIEDLISDRFKAEKSYRLIEAEVGPIKYIAEFIYGSSDQDLLEEAVRWVIIIIIFVFDPLAVLLLIASQYTFEYEQKRKTERKEKTNSQQQPESLDSNNQTHFETLSPKTRRAYDEQDLAVFQKQAEEPQKKSIELPEELNSETKSEEERIRLESWNQKAETLKDAKHNWKDLHPEETIKFYKTLYVKGKIDQLPWENEKYIQNSEQNENSLFKKIQDARKDEKD